MISLVLALLTLAGCYWGCLLWYRVSSGSLDTHLERALLLQRCPCGAEHDPRRPCATQAQ